MKRITVSELRKLAKSKGLELRQGLSQLGVGADGEGMWVKYRTVYRRRPLTYTQAGDALYAALLTLPDKPKDKKRGVR